MRHIDELLARKRDIAVYTHRDGWLDKLQSPERAVVLAGSFRPLHRAHRTLLSVATDIAGNDTLPCFEISLHNVEKATIAKDDLIERIAQFSHCSDVVILTCAATFLEKARLMPGATFAIGYDTAIRLFDDRFYQASNDAVSPSLRAMSEIRSLGCRFIVGGRHDAGGEFKTLHDIDFPHQLSDMLTAIPQNDFADPISSTHIRRSKSAT